MFDLEVWAMNPELADEMGEAAFDITIEADSGDGFGTVLDLGRVSTGVTLLKPRNGRLDGNEDISRVSFDSGFRSLELPIDSMLRVRLGATSNTAIGHITFGVDEFQLQTVPEATGGLMMMLGMIVISAVRRRRGGSSRGSATLAQGRNVSARPWAVGRRSRLSRREAHQRLAGSEVLRVVRHARQCTHFFGAQDDPCHALVCHEIASRLMQPVTSSVR